MRALPALLALLLTSACAPPVQPESPDAGLPGCDTAGAGGTLEALFEAHFATTQATGCTASGCHGTGAGGLTFTTPQQLWAATVDRPAVTDPQRRRVVPGDPANSVLIRRLHASAGTKRMPQGGPYLDDAAVAAVTAWICAGAPAPAEAPDAGEPDAGDSDAGEAVDAGEPDAGEAPDAGPAGPVVDGFAPESGVAGTPVVIQGSGFAEESADNAVTFGGVAAVVTAAEATRLDVLVPEGAVAGPVRVEVAGLAATSATEFQVIVPNPVPQLDSLTPAAVEAGAPETVLTLHGAAFVALSTAVLEGENLATVFVSATELQATVPAAMLAMAGERSVSVISPGPGGGASAARVLEVRNPSPRIDLVEPARFELGTTPLELVVRGAGFLPATTATLNGAALALTPVDAATLRFTLPASARAAAATLSLVVSNPAPGGGDASATLEVVHPAPVLTSLTPASVVADGGAHELRLVGGGFLAASQVTVSGTAVTVIEQTPELLVVTAGPAFSAIGAVHPVVVTNPLPGGGGSAPISWTVLNPAPTAASVAPQTLPAGGAETTVTVTGTGFNASSQVLLDGSGVATTFRTATRLEAMVPTFAGAGGHTLAVRNPAPGGGTSGTVALAVEVFTTPVITGLTPQPATAGEAFTLTIDGAGFACGTTPSRILLDSLDIPAATCAASTLTASVAALRAGAVAVKVRNPSQGLESEPATLHVVEPNPAPAIDSLDPATGVAGSAPPVVTVRGSGFVGASVATVDGADRATTFVAADELTVALTTADLASAGSRSVRVRSPAPGGGTSDAATFTVVAPNPVPSISSLVPAGVVAGGGATMVTVRGSGFIPLSVVSLDGGVRTTTFVDAGELTFELLAEDTAEAGARAIVVTNPAPGGGSSAAFALTVAAPNPAPVLSGVTPDAVPVGSGATAVQLDGSGFLSSSTVLVGGGARATTFVSSTRLEVTLTAAEVANAGTLELAVRTPAPGGGTSETRTLSIVNPTPVATALVPDAVLAGAAAFAIELNGSGFVSSSVVRLDGSARTTRFVNTTRLSADLLAGDVATAGTRSLTVATPGPGGGVSPAVPLQVNNAVPSIGSLTPDAVDAGSGAVSLRVDGAGFVSTSTVRFDGVERPTTFVSRTRLTASLSAADVTTPASHAVAVTSPAPGGGESAAAAFTVRVPPNPVPEISVLSPCGVVAGADAFTLTITGGGFVAGTTATFRGSAVSVTRIDAGTLEASIPAALVATSPADAAVELVVTNPAPGGGDSNAVTFGLASQARTLAANVQPIFTTNCIECHTAFSGLPDLLSGQAAASLVGVQSSCGGREYVQVCKPLPSQSFLVAKVTGLELCGARMPRDRAPLSAGDIRTIIDWVAQGAP